MKLKLISLLLCVSMLAVCFAGCGSEPPKVTVTESPAPTESPLPSESPAPTEAPVETPTDTPDPETEARDARFRAAYEKYAPDQTVMLVNGEPVSWSKYYSWIYDIANQLEQTYQVTDWNEPREELAAVSADSTYGTYVRQTALDYVVQVAVIGQKAKELGVELTEEQRTQLKSTLDGYAERFGGQDKLEELLSDSYLTMDYFTEQNEAMILMNDLYEHLYGSNGENVPDEDVIACLKDQGYLYAKHILFRTVDDDRQPLPEDEIAAKRAEAEEVLAQLSRCPQEDLPSLFDSLMQQYNEDPGMLSYPDGYYFVAGQMVPAFEETVRTLEENGLSGLVETDYGFHIIFCPPMSSAHLMGYDSNGSPYKTKAFVSASLFDNVMREWYTDAEKEILYVGDFGELDLNELFRQ